jgi:molybdenum cofactor cytidylyltransferase
LLVEADGARQKPLKAPAWHEPAIPHFVDLVITCAGLTALGHPLTDEWVHRSEIFARLADLPSGATITAQAVVRVLAHTDGGLKSVPEAARRVVLLNQASSPELQAQAARMAGSLLDSFAAVVVASLDRQMVSAVHERTAGIVLAAGESKRFGRPKQLLDFHGRPFVRATAEAALAAGLDPVIVVTGANAEQVEMALAGLPVQITRNEGWQSGQASSVRVGLRALGLLPFPTPAAADPAANDGGWDRVGAAIFLLADQPQVTADVLRALVEFHAREMPFVASPMVEDRRANPTLFDRTTFPELVQLAGEEGGRALFSKYPPVYLPWLDPGLLRDVDTPADYERLIGHE